MTSTSTDLDELVQEIEWSDDIDMSDMHSVPLPGLPVPARAAVQPPAVARACLDLDDMDVSDVLQDVMIPSVPARPAPPPVVGIALPTQPLHAPSSATHASHPTPPTVVGVALPEMTFTAYDTPVSGSPVVGLPVPMSLQPPQGSSAAHASTAAPFAFGIPVSVAAASSSQQAREVAYVRLCVCG